MREAGREGGRKGQHTQTDIPSSAKIACRKVGLPASFSPGKASEPPPREVTPAEHSTPASGRRERGDKGGREGGRENNVPSSVKIACRKVGLAASFSPGKASEPPPRGVTPAEQRTPTSGEKERMYSLL